MLQRKKISLLGSTGSIGKSTLRVARHLKNDLEIIALAAKSNIELLYSQALEFSPKLIAVFEEDQAMRLQKRLPHIPVLFGIDGLKTAASFEEADFTMLAMTGSAGLIPAAAAIEAGKQIGLANKEILVAGGEWISALVKKTGVEMIPVDSEHCALHQCLRGQKKEEVRRLILTASGGALRDKTVEELKNVTPLQALSHPNWEMGSKVTIDCTTLMNKGLEIIEARFLFDIDPEKIEAVIHPQSRIHSCVEFIDGSILAQIADPDMALPIQYALTFPFRKPGFSPPYDFFKNGSLTFYPPDMKKFPCLQLALNALKAGKSYPCFLNAANEVLVARFMQGEIPWTAIGEKLDKLISSHRGENVLSLEAILAVDQSARRLAAIS
ncbi:MAG TPA: 1-deoxy-D-xylulose-5-phosphate reductoisomerase [Chlamydiales bacterium]|nr:1-deoxy-D-xylulose-5-phosphate reductoisomerase [Chlamydiales bacterium]